MAEKKVIEIDAKTKGAEKDIENLTKKVDDLSQSQKQTAEATNSIASSIGTLTKGALIGVAIKAFESFTEVLNNNQKVADFFSTSLEFVSIAFNDLVNFVLDNITPVTDGFKALFDDPLESVKNLAQAIKENLIERFNSMIETVGLAGKAIAAFFRGDFSESADFAAQAATEFVDVLTGVDNSVEKMGEVIDTVTESTSNYISRTYEAAKSNVELAKTSEVAAIANQGLIEKYDRLAEQQRQIRDEERNTIEERIAANNKLNEILDEQEKAMLANVDLQIAAAQAQYDKNQNQENYIALLEAQIEKDAVLAQIEGFRSEQKANDLALSRELAQVDRDRLQTEIDNFRTIEEAKAESIQNEEARAKRQIEIEEMVYNKTVALLEARLAAEKEGSTAYAEILNERATLDAEYAAAKMQLQTQVVQGEVDGVREGLLAIGDAVATSSQGQKDFAIAEAIINTLVSITASLRAGGVVGFVQAAASAAAGYKTVRDIVNTPLPSGPGGSTRPSGGTVAANTSAPSFNIVAAQQQTELLSDINQAQNQPTRAYVVSKDISTAQELDRNRIKNATI